MPQTACVLLDRLDPSPTPATDDPLAWLQNAHGRIRRFADLAVRLAERPTSPNARDVAADLHRYFGVALALHTRDEDESLAPRLARVAPLELARGLVRQAHDHVAHEAALAAMLPRWRNLARGREIDLVAFGHQSAALRDDLVRHLKQEEREVFPLARRHLSATTLQRIAAEMRARRTSEAIR